MSVGIVDFSVADERGVDYKKFSLPPLCSHFAELARGKLHKPFRLTTWLFRKQDVEYKEADARW